MKLTVEDATMDHVRQVLEDIRPADLREWYAGTGDLFEVAVEDALKRGDPQKVALRDGVPLVFWGWDSEGAIWLFATTTAERNALALHRILRGELSKITEQHKVVSATADARNLKHHEWLQWLGFRPIMDVFMGPFALPFIVFIKEA